MRQRLLATPAQAPPSRVSVAAFHDLIIKGDLEKMRGLEGQLDVTTRARFGISAAMLARLLLLPSYHMLSRLS